MFCSRCGTEVGGRERFCPTCGLDLQATTPVQAIAAPELTETDLVREALQPKFDVVAELGRGGMAIVFRARDRTLDREVAIKVLPFALAFDADFVERFQREARTAASLEHPHIIPVYGVDRAGRVTYFVMKYLRGGSLSALLRERRRLTPPEIRRLLIEAASALGFAAQRGVVHRDIKPDNILFDEFGRTVLCDFGIAKAASGRRLTGTGMAIGTPHYMSPEQARAQPLDGRSDIYSLGIVAYEALVGAVPFDAEDSFTIGYKHITEPLPVPELGDDDARALYALIARMTAKAPDDRPQSAEALVEALQAGPVAAHGLGVGGAPVRALAPLPVARSSTALPPLGSGSAPSAAPATSPPPSVEPMKRRAAPPAPSRRSRVPLVVGVAAAAGVGGVLLLRRGPEVRPAAVGPRADTTAAAIARPEVDSSPPGPGAVDTAAVAADVGADAGVAAPASDGTGGSGATPPGSTSVPRARDTARSPASARTVAVGDTADPDALRRRALAELRLVCRVPSRQYLRCFDERPKPTSLAVELPLELTGDPDAFVMWVRVARDGSVLEVRRIGSSGVARFDRAAQLAVQLQRFTPARKDGVPVTAWTQVQVVPQP